MSGKNYTLEEAAAKLGKSPEEFKRLVKQNQISELREGSQILYSAKDVDALANSQSDDTVLNIEDSVIGLSDESSLLGLAPGEDLGDDDQLDIDADMSSMVELSEADTHAGITAADQSDSIISLSDSMPDEPIEPEQRIDADADIESAAVEGSGSGLLDLSLQADDSQFGAVLDDILPGDSSGPAGFGDFAEEEVPTSAPADAGIEQTASDQYSAPEPSYTAPTGSSIPETAPPVAAVVYQSSVDPSSGIFGFMMLLPFLLLIFASIVLVAGFRAITPIILSSIEDYLLYIVIGFGAVSLILAIVGAMGGSEKKDKPIKQKKEKKPAKGKKKK